MNAQSAVRQQLSFWQRTLDQVLADCTPELLNQKPAGTLTSIGSIYAHIVFAEDVIVNVRLQARQPLYESGGWQARVGVPFPGLPPALSPEWAAAVQMDLPSFQDYARAVRDTSDAYLAALSDAEMERKVESSSGDYSVGFYAVNILATHLPQHAGEISAIKGIQGLQGLPF